MRHLSIVARMLALLAFLALIVSGCSLTNQVDSSQPNTSADQGAVLTEALDDELGDHWLGERGQPTHEAKEPSAEQRPAVRADMGKQQPPRGLLADTPSRCSVEGEIDLGRRDHGVQGTVNSVRK